MNYFVENIQDCVSKRILVVSHNDILAKAGINRAMVCCKHQESSVSTDWSAEIRSTSYLQPFVTEFLKLYILQSVRCEKQRDPADLKYIQNELVTMVNVENSMRIKEEVFKQGTKGETCLQMEVQKEYSGMQNWTCTFYPLLSYFSFHQKVKFQLDIIQYWNVLTAGICPCPFRYRALSCSHFHASVKLMILQGKISNYFLVPSSN